MILQWRNFKKMAGIFGVKGLTKQAEMAAVKALEYQDKKEQRGFNSEKYKLRLEQERTQLAEKNIHYRSLFRKPKKNRERVSYRPS